MNSQIIHVVGGAFRLSGNDMDTDRIIPARFLKCVTFEGLGKHVFEDDRAQLKGEHPFDQPENQGLPILVVDENFGSGSSREHAVPALTQFGIKAIIGLSFAEIFRGNAVGNGLVCVTVDKVGHALISSMFDRKLKEVAIDLEKLSMSTAIEGGGEITGIPCGMSPSHREMLITGRWDSLATCLEAGHLIDEAAARLPYMARMA